MRTKRFLLVTAALSTAAAGSAACGKSPAADAGETLPLPANPKGSFYDANIPPPPPGDADTPADAGTTQPLPSQDGGAGPTPTPTRRPLPANPKGSHYDAGKKKPNLDF